jgi:lysozyme family protein
MTRDEAIALMVRLEGGFVDNPKDPGGATKFGITQKTLDYWRSRLASPLPANVRDLAVADASRIYELTDWAQIHGDQLPVALAVLVLNSAVNQGEETAIRLLQAALRIPQTGAIGPPELAAIEHWHSPYMPEQTLAEEYCAQVAVRYAHLDSTEAVFELGWFRRLMRVYTAAVTV